VEATARPAPKATILVVDDEEAIQRMLAVALAREGYRVVEALDGERALQLVTSERPDLILLDVMLPGIDGLEVCRQVRATSQVPIIMLTARDDEIEKVLGLELGADDYVTKPFFIAELRSRIRAVLRRADRSAWSASDDVLSVDGIVLDSARRTVQAHGSDVALTYVEFEILRTMMASPGRVFSRQSLLEAVWESADYRDPRTIDVHVRHLREKLEPNPREPVYIHTVRGVGYRFRG
jgi:two-component system OmpR family response regulator/two-component system alkaline phosphatase synthesis response regulator PhoP